MTFTDYQSSPATMRLSGVHDTLQTNPGKPRPINPMAGAFSFGLAMASTSIGRRSARASRACVSKAARRCNGSSEAVEAGEAIGAWDDTALLLDPSRAVRRFQPSILNHLPSNPITHSQQTCAIWVPQDT
jgi:hypothetical protein